MTILHCSSIPAVHHAYDDAIADLDRRARIGANIDAIRLAREFEQEDRTVSPEKLAVLDRFTGWGMPCRPLRDQLCCLLGEDEWHAAAAATLTAFHTPRCLTLSPQGRRSLMARLARMERWWRMGLVGASRDALLARSMSDAEYRARRHALHGVAPTGVVFVALGSATRIERRSGAVPCRGDRRSVER
ncbi:hypothetical protein [Thalassobaculum sp.]|uniref:hypothetical protein n=1 Tax=Thalassobaculum sp. TaxID=2022740 RepID=UPI0032EFC8F0